MVERVNQAAGSGGWVTDMRPLSRDGNRHEERQDWMLIGMTTQEQWCC
jgi:hypothetical protein